jgi:hypothetical protein
MEWRGEMGKDASELMHALVSTTRAIERAVAEQLDLGNPNEMTLAELNGLRRRTENVILEYGECMRRKELWIEWPGAERRIATPKIGRLLQQRREIAEQILKCGMTADATHEKKTADAKHEKKGLADLFRDPGGLLVEHRKSSI